MLTDECLRNQTIFKFNDGFFVLLYFITFVNIKKLTKNQRNI